MFSGGSKGKIGKKRVNFEIDKTIKRIAVRTLTLSVTCTSGSCVEIKIELNFYFHTSL